MSDKPCQKCPLVPPNRMLMWALETDRDNWTATALEEIEDRLSVDDFSDLANEPPSWSSREYGVD